MKLVTFALLTAVAAVLCSSCTGYTVRGRVCYNAGLGSACIGADGSGANIDVQLSGK